MKNKKIILFIALIVCIVATIVAIATGVSSKQSSSTTTTNDIKISTTIEEASSKEISKADNTTASSTTKQSKASTTKKSLTTKSSTESTTKNNTTVSQTKATTSVKPTTTTTAKATTETTVTTSKSNVCYITIECTEILSNMDKLKEGHSAYVPSNGYILNNYPVEISNGDSAYDVLKRACGDNNIKLTATTTAYGTYVSGINNLDEFDCARQSGWLYYVDNNYQNVSCDKRIIKPNETITFHYTVK